MIMLNALTIGMETDYMAANWTDQVPCCYRVTEFLFTVVFAVELTMRIAAYGSSYFCGHEAAWNMFDAALILMQVAEQIISVIVFFMDAQSAAGREIAEYTDGTNMLLILRIF